MPTSQLQSVSPPRFVLTCVYGARGANVQYQVLSVWKMSHCLKVLIRGAAAPMPPLLTLTLQAVIISPHCPRHLLHRAIKVSLTLTLM